jgi:putative transcriptional regulator
MALILVKKHRRRKLKLGNRLKYCRFDHDDMTQEALAEAVGVTRQTVLSVEKGRYVPSAMLALKMAAYFGKPVEDIFFLVEETASKGEES